MLICFFLDRIHNLSPFQWLLVLSIIFVEPVSAFGAEFRRCGFVFGFPTALVAAICLRNGRTLASAFLTEFSLIYCSAAACPTAGRCGIRLRFSAVSAKLSVICLTTLANPTVV